MKTVIDKVKDSIDIMPTLSPVVHKITEVANNVKSSAQDLTDVIQLDPVLTAKVIRMVNSAYFAMPAEVKTLKPAVIMLGLNTIKNVALSSAFLGKVHLKSNTPLSGQDFWKHSLGVGVASKLIARKLGIDSKLIEEYFIAGLIHDIGKVLINNSFPDEMKEILDTASKKQEPIANIERRILGLTHEEIGIAIGKKWKFANNLLYAMGRHHQPVIEGVSATYSMIVSIADTFVKILKVGFSGNYVIEPVTEDVWKALSINEETVFETLSTMNEEIEKAEIFLK